MKPSVLLAALSLLLSTSAVDAQTHHYYTHRKHVVHVASHPVVAIDNTPIVWVNTKTGVYHFSGERYYGRTEEGKYVHEDAAIAEGDRPTENGQ